MGAALGGRVSDHPVLSLLPPAFAASNPNERTPTAHSRCIQNSLHEPHAHPTPNTDTKPKYLPRPKPTLKRRFRSLKAFFPPCAPTSSTTAVRVYLDAMACSSVQLHGVVGKCFDVGREGELGEGEDAGGAI